ncbi:hypothetical protein ACFL1G_00970 [Planctomycetota bacterium]
MVKEQVCQHCFYKNDCQKVYEHLGKAEGPSVAWKAVTAFLIPITVFIAVLTLFERLLAETLTGKELRTAVSFLLALFVTSLVIFTIKKTSKKFNKDG